MTISCEYCGIELPTESALDSHIRQNHTDGWSGQVTVRKEEPNGYKFKEYGFGKVIRDDGEILDGDLEEEEED